VITPGAPKGALLAKQKSRMKDKDEISKQVNDDKDNLSQQDIKSGIKNFAEGDKPHAALEKPA
jgi:hypothetical protein